MKTFTITENHLKLVQQLYFSDGSDYSCAPEVNQKRPFGNSDWEWDAFEILHPEQATKLRALWNEGLADDQYDKLCVAANKYMSDLVTVLQICTKTLAFEAGTYQCEQYTTNWVKVE